jgi:hypothetical protein
MKRMIFNWKLKSEIWLFWEMRKDPKNEDELKSEKWSGIVMREKDDQKNNDELKS